MPKQKEFDLHVWVKPETERTLASYTISSEGSVVCKDLPLSMALRSLSLVLEEAALED